MKAVLQRVSCASVRVDGELVGACGPGLLVLLGVLKGDGPAEAARLADKIAQWRCFPPADPAQPGAIGAGKMSVSVLDRGLEVLVVSQVTLAADGRKGRRPSLDLAAPPELGEQLYEAFVAHLAGLGLRTARGRFGALMEVQLTNHGPLTFVL
ncbi:MAG: D-tyrosyl-tRNA(Tyr) deacylase, partial [Planctomycetota bacterium]